MKCAPFAACADLRPATPALADSARRGEQLYFDRRFDCDHCDQGVLVADNLQRKGGAWVETGFPDTGLHAAYAATAPCMRDGSIPDLHGVLAQYALGGREGHVNQDGMVVGFIAAQAGIADITAFPESLTRQAFLTDPDRADRWPETHPARINRADPRDLMKGQTMKRTLLALMLVASPALAHDQTSGDLHIIHPMIPQPAASAKSAAGYVTISNDGETPEALIGVRTPFARSSTLHTTIHEDGIAKMRPLTELVIEPGDTVNLEPDGMHLMFMGLTGEAQEGDRVPATLIFRNAGEVAVEFMVDPATGADHSTMDHGSMDHSTMDHSGH